MSDKGYVIKFDNGLYFRGLNFASPQLWKAKIYHSKKEAEEIAGAVISRKSCLSCDSLKQTRNLGQPGKYEIVVVEIREVNEE